MCFVFVHRYRDKRRRSGSRTTGPADTDKAPGDSFAGAGAGTLTAEPGAYGPGHSPAKRLRCARVVIV